MSDKTKIEWSDATWNPITGCTKVSEGCRNCYALTFAERWRGTPGHYFENGFDITLRPDKLDQPLKWKRPRKIFVNSMSDLFHKDIPDEFIDIVFAVMALAPQHTFQVLTKRPDRMNEYVNAIVNGRPRYTKWATNGARWMQEHGIRRTHETPPQWPLPNVWLGTSVENQQAADERIPHLLATPAAVRFLSMEPLLGKVDFNFCKAWNARDNDLYLDGIHWIITGSESGPRNKIRAMDEEWVRTIRDQCLTANVPFFYKQNVVNGEKISLPELEGVQWAQFPQTKDCQSGNSSTLF